MSFLKNSRTPLRSKAAVSGLMLRSLWTMTIHADPQCPGQSGREDTSPPRWTALPASLSLDSAVVGCRGTSTTSLDARRGSVKSCVSAKLSARRCRRQRKRSSLNVTSQPQPPMPSIDELARLAAYGELEMLQETITDEIVTQYGWSDADVLLEGLRVDLCGPGGPRRAAISHQSDGARMLSLLRC